jgi:hypothetical protein
VKTISTKISNNECKKSVAIDGADIEIVVNEAKVLG